MSSKKKVVTPTNLCPFPTIPEECADGWSFHFINSAKGLLTEHNNTGTTKLSLLALITPSELLNHLAPAHPQSVYWVNSRLYWMDGRGCSTRGSISIEQHEPIILTILPPPGPSSAPATPEGPGTSGPPPALPLPCWPMVRPPPTFPAPTLPSSTNLPSYPSNLWQTYRAALDSQYSVYLAGLGGEQQRLPAYYPPPVYHQLAAAHRFHFCQT